MPGMFAWCSKTLRSMWNLSMWYMFFLRVSRYRDADRVESAATCRPGVRRRFVSSKIFTFAPIARTRANRQPGDDALSCSPHFSNLTPYRAPFAWKVARAIRVNPCYIIYTVAVARGVYRNLRFFSFKLSILRDALTRFIFYSTELSDILKFCERQIKLKKMNAFMILEISQFFH